MDEKLLAALIALGGVIGASLLNLYWNFHSARAARRQPFLQVQLDACLRASRAAATLATSMRQSEMELAREEFWKLYWGELCIVEDDQVERAMVNFANKLETGSGDEIKVASLLLSRVIRKLVLKSWKIDLPELSEVR